MRLTIKPQMITLQILKEHRLNERLFMTIDENYEITNQIDYIITNRTIAIIISITVFQRN